MSFLIGWAVFSCEVMCKVLGLQYEFPERFRQQFLLGVGEVLELEKTAVLQKMRRGRDPSIFVPP
ncbi:hypothetical protein DND36_00505 [Pseudomonas savastanoi pv. glycinea]|nr:hypothetical protein DND36_00505 [Pseudomonas savastanoi pv. glycinea]